MTSNTKIRKTSKKTHSSKNGKRRPSASKKKGKKQQKSVLKGILIRFSIYSILLTTCLLGLLFTTIYLGFWGRMPNYHTLKEISNATASEIYTENGVLMGRIYTENRTEVAFKNISSHTIEALIATEDARFYQHQGVDQRSLLRVLFKTLLLGDRNSGGGSTLSQQLAKNLYPRRNYGPLSMPVNKIQEALIASRLEKIYTKKEILQLYLNTVPFGEQVFGIESASHRYFSVGANRLSTEQAALLVGMLKAPSYYNPRLHPKRAITRRNVVLNQMVKNNVLSIHQAQKLKKRPLNLKYQRNTANNGLAPYLRERIRLQAQQWLKSHPKEDGTIYNLYTDGLSITTTINSHIQQYAQKAMNSHMATLQNTFYSHWGKKTPWRKSENVIEIAMKRSHRYKKCEASGISKKQILKIFKKPVKMKIFTWKGDKEVTMSPLDSIIHYQKILRSGFMAMDPKSGKILAWIGGINFKHFKYDHVMAKRQVGSIFKPIVYAAALENGASPLRYYTNEKKEYTQYDNWSPRNADNNYTGSYSMEGALAESVNTVAVDVLLETGLQSVTAQAQEMGIDSHLPQVPSLALGTANISLFEMIQTYSCLANQGKHVTPYYLVNIKDRNGHIIHDFVKDREKPRLVMDPENARILTHMLQAVVDNGTARSLRRVYGLTNDLAGKTGTTQSQADGWFIGYTPNLVAGAWVGAEDIRVHFRTLTYGQGAYMALPIFGKFMHMVNSNTRLRKYNNAHFAKPSPFTLAKMNIPHYLPPRTNLFDRLFGRKDNAIETQQKMEHVKHERKEKRSIYQRIRNIFRKK